MAAEEAIVMPVALQPAATFASTLRVKDRPDG
jgi:hypothetical protein